MTTPQIVTVKVSQTSAPTPSTLQSTGFILSQGGTNLAAGTTGLLTQLSDLTPIVEAVVAITSISWASGLATVTVPAGTLPAASAEPIAVVISGATPAGYNGTVQATVTGATTFTYPLATSPGTATAPGVLVVGDAPELLAQLTTFYAQGNDIAVYVLELGAGSPAQGVAALTTYLTANPASTNAGLPGAPTAPYLILVPREWDGEATFLPLIAQYEALTSGLYFYVTTTIATYSRYTNLMKCVVAVVEAPGVNVAGGLEFSAAAFFQVELSYAPSTIQRITPYCYGFLYGVTPYPVKGNSALLTTLAAAAINYVATGYEGGISTAMIYPGMTKDGRPVNYWYAVDWARINGELDLANEVINGSNNPQAPLDYDQPGVNRLQARAQGTMTRGVTYGIILSPVTVTAVPFVPYVTANESDFKTGTYKGIGVSFSPARGFQNITFQMNVTDFPPAS